MQNKAGRGFTLVEILVVIAIIAILAGVALPAVTGAIKKAKENAAMQTGRGLAMSAFQFANDNDQTWPGGNPNATPPVTLSGSTDAFKAMMGYVGNTDALCLTGAGQSKYTGSTPATGISSSNVSWDFTVHSDNTGLTVNDPDQTPLFISTGSTVTYGTSGTAAPATAVISKATTNPFGNDGVAVAFKDCTAASKVCATAGTAFNISSVSFEPATKYSQLTP